MLLMTKELEDVKVTFGLTIEREQYAIGGKVKDYI